MYLHSVSVTKLESSVWKKTIQAKKILFSHYPTPLYVLLEHKALIVWA